MLKKRVCFIVLLLVSAFSAMADNNRFTLVIDAGHGGHDQGAPGAISVEKDLTLKYALAFGKLVEQNCPDVKVVYTRKTDTYVTLYDRAEIANRAKADLFISIHINALDGVHTAHGFQSYTLGRGQNTGDRGIKQNVEVAKRENAVILMEKDYKTVYKGMDLNSPEGDIMFEFIADKNRERSVDISRMMQSEVCAATGRQNGGAHQNNLAVLRLTSMPGVLLELGFISTPDEEQFLNSDEALDRYSKGIYNAFIRYKNKYDTHITVPYKTSSSDRSGQTIKVSPPTSGGQSPAALTVPDRANSDSNRLRQTFASTRERVAPASDRSAKRQKTASGTTPADKKAADKKAAKQHDNSEKATAAANRKNSVDNSKPVFKIQILVSSRRLRSGDEHFKGLEGCDFYEEGNFKKYTYGASNNYNEIYRLRKQILDKFPQSFIIAFKNGKKIDVNEGIKEFKLNR
jgi:N-acetylmuramoyl-L-alanine amidase